MPVKDITDKAAHMERGTAILYRNRKPKDGDAAAYGGLLRLSDGQTFWAFIWPRKIGKKDVVELRLVPKREGSCASD
jgi:hypothetical protein